MAQAISTTVWKDGEVNVAELLRLLFRHWKFISFSVLVTTALTTAFAFSITPLFQADVLLSPVSSDSTKERLASLAGLASQFGGGGAATAGINFSPGNTKAVSVATLQSRVLTEAYIRDENLLPVLFSSKWNQQEQKWNISDPKKIPTVLDGNNFFDKSIRKISEDKLTGLVRLSIRWKDPVQAAKWANDLVARTNLYLQQTALEESNRNIAYLQEQLRTTSIVELQQSIGVLLGAEIKTAMLAQGNREYAFHVIDPAVIPEHKVSPKRSLYALFGFFLGLLASSSYVLAKNAVRTRK